MNYNILFPQSINAEINLPASKSISNRALIINALSTLQGELINIAHCDDTDAMVAALNSCDTNINIGAAGTAMRFLTGYFAMQNGRNVILDGSARMRQRPLRILVDALEQCGAKIEYLSADGFPPIAIIGAKLDKCSDIELPGNISSQYISSLMMIAPLMPKGLKIHLTGDIMSIPYIDMTLSLMQQFGIKCHRENDFISIENGEYSLSAFTIESDWSAASYWYEIVALLPDSKILLKGLTENSIQGDSFVLNIFEQLGVESKFIDSGVLLSATRKVTNFLDLDLSKQPDLAQTIVVSACMLDVSFNITGLATLKIKETDRIEALRSQLYKLGYVISVSEDNSLSWTGEKCMPQSTPEIDTFDDHRMAMSFAPVAIKFPNLRINNIEVVSKSYPDFWNHLLSCGVNLK
ncbi:MAG: 3-phosphoshikimate 1-carboxyvinyltransferase [Muribaculaceae bacterium]|nr:3-phosphoshikimate 1-carboxyvinyltransferase [Muribaculaceae bacterium]